MSQSGGTVFYQGRCSEQTAEIETHRGGSVIHMGTIADGSYAFRNIRKEHAHTRCTDLVDSADLTLDAVVLDPCATCSLVTWHVQTHHMPVLGEILQENKQTHPSEMKGVPQCILILSRT